MTYYNLSLINPSDPQKDPLFRTDWKNPLVSLDKAIKYQTAGPNDIIVGDPTNFNIDTKSGLGGDFDWGWDLEYGKVDFHGDAKRILGPI